MIRSHRYTTLWLLVVAATGCDCSADANNGVDAASDAQHGDAQHNDAHTNDDANVASDAATDATTSIDASHTRHDGAVASCQGVECHLIDNGCGASNRACYFLPPGVGQDPEPTCAAAGDNGPGTVCTSQQQCAPGLGCDPTNRCRNYCCDPGYSAECPNGQACLVEYRDTTDQSLGVGLCQDCDECDPTSGDGCANNLACYPASFDGACRLCLPPRTNGNVAAACTTHSDCRSTLGCDGTECRRFCGVAAGTECGASERCVAIGYTGLPDLGFCRSL